MFLDIFQRNNLKKAILAVFRHFFIKKLLFLARFFALFEVTNGDADNNLDRLFVQI